MEIERKWMVNGWPEGENFPALPLKEEFAMRQGYISVRPTVRIREEALKGGETAYILCFKSGSGLAREEIERPIDKKLFDELETKIPELLKDIQANLLQKATERRDSKTYVAHNMEEFEKEINETPGFIKAMWCGDQACEDAIKEKTAATSRCIPFEQEEIDSICVCCGKPAKHMVYWGRAY